MGDHEDDDRAFTDGLLIGSSNYTRVVPPAPDDFAAARIRETAAASVAARKAEIDAAERRGWLAGRDAAVEMMTLSAKIYSDPYSFHAVTAAADIVRAMQPPEPGKDTP